nr:transposase [Ruminococcus bromii]
MNAFYNKLVTKHLPKLRLYMIDFIYSRNLAEMLSALFVWMKFAGFNNKIKVAKRIGYGYRDDDFFFTLIRYLSIPSDRSPYHQKS